MFEKYKKEITILSIIIIIPLILIGLYYIFKSPVGSKQTKNGNMPYLNVKGKEVEEVNEYIEKIYKEYSNNSKNKLKYKTNTYGDLVSVIIEINEYNSELKSFIKKYVGFNVKKDGTYIDDEKLTEMFNLSLLDVLDIVGARLRSYYDDEVMEGYIEGEECDFKCYLGYARGIDNIMDETTLVVEDNKLVAYINLSKDNVSGDKEYFDNLDFDPYRVVIEK